MSMARGLGTSHGFSKPATERARSATVDGPIRRTPHLPPAKSEIRFDHQQTRADSQIARVRIFGVPATGTPKMERDRIGAGAPGLLDRVEIRDDQAFPGCPCFVRPAEGTFITAGQTVFLVRSAPVERGRVRSEYAVATRRR